MLMVAALPFSSSDPTLSPGIMTGAAQRLLSELDTSFLSGSQSELLREVLRFAARAEGEIGSRQSRIRKLEAGSLVDDLTGLENERGLRSAVDRMIAASGRYGGSHVLVLLAIDGLEDIQDRLGRPVEQLVLQQLASELRRRTRGADVLARTGRNEFAALLTPCPAEHAASKAATLAAHLGGLPLRYQDQTLAITVTTGCAPFGADTSFERIAALAHQMLSRRWEPRFNARPAQKPHFGRRGLVAPTPDSQ
jgi:diguanylate cyclase (GGDEF)-like protein